MHFLFTYQFLFDLTVVDKVRCSKAKCVRPKDKCIKMEEEEEKVGVSCKTSVRWKPQFFFLKVATVEIVVQHSWFIA